MQSDRRTTQNKEGGVLCLLVFFSDERNLSILCTEENQSVEELKKRTSEGWIKILEKMEEPQT